MKIVRRIWFVGVIGWAFVMAVPPARADEKGQTVLREAFKTLQDAKTLTADLSISVANAPGPAPQSLKGKVALMKPNYLRVELEGPQGQSFFADGKYYYMYSPAAKRYIRRSLSPNPTEFQGLWEGEIDAFFGGVKSAEKVTATYVGTEKIGDVECGIVKVEMKEPDRTAVYAIGKTDRLIHRAVLSFPLPNREPVKQTNTLTNIKLNVPKTAADFEFKPSADAQLFDPEKEMEEQIRQLESTLLAVGEKAPEFDLPLPTGGRLSLADARKEKKAVLVNFWFYN